MIFGLFWKRSLDFVHDILVVLYVLIKLMALLRLVCVASGSLSVISILYICFVYSYKIESQLIEDFL